MNSSPQPGFGSQPLEAFIRDLIHREGPISFARFMEMALYHPEHGYYSSGRCTIGRRGDYFTSVSVGPLFGKFVAAQFAEIWEKLERPNDFKIIEQGAHHGEFAADVLAVLRQEYPELFQKLCYRVIEPFAILRQRQKETLSRFADRTEWISSVTEMEPFCGVHFSNELLDAMPVHLVSKNGAHWQERVVTTTSNGFVFLEQAVADERLQTHLAKMPLLPNDRYETEINLAVLDWISALAPKLRRGVILAADYGFAREEFYAQHRSAGTLQSRAAHRLASPLASAGASDLTAHVEWTSLAERAESCGLTIAGFTDQNHFLTGLLASVPTLAAASAQQSRALHTLLHPELLGMKFQLLALTKNYPSGVSLGGYKFARDPRAKLGLA